MDETVNVDVLAMLAELPELCGPNGTNEKLEAFARKTCKLIEQGHKLHAFVASVACCSSMTVSIACGDRGAARRRRCQRSAASSPARLR